MATIPAGSLLFSGFGDATAKFLSPDGVDLGDPDSGPLQLDKSCDGIVYLPGADNHVPMVGGGDIFTPGGPKFPTTGVGIFASDFATWVEGGTGAHGFPQRSMARDDAGHFYGTKDVGPYIMQYTADGTQTGVWGPLAFGNTAANVLAVNAAGTRAYYSAAGSIASDNNIYAWDLSGNADLGVFTTESTFFVSAFCSMTCVGSELIVGWSKTATNGYLKRYNASGVLQATYTLTGTAATPIVLTPGLDDTSIWVNYYNSDLATFSGVTISEIELATGDVLHTFAPEDGTFEFDSPMCVVMVASTPPGTLTLPIRRARAFMIPDNNQQWIFFKALQIYLETGIGNDAAADPLLHLRWSDDAGHTWSNYHTVSAGIAGAYSVRAIWRQLGRARNRVFEFYVDDPVAWSAIQAYADMESGIS